MASQEPPDVTRNRSSVEVEQILPCTEHGPDPRDFYASDSPVLDEYFGSGQGSGSVDPEVEDDDQVENIIAFHVWFSYLTYTSRTNCCETFPATSGPTARVFACSAPFPYCVFTNRWAFVTNCRAFVFVFATCWAFVLTDRWAFILANHWAFFLANRRAFVFTFANSWAFVLANSWAFIFANSWASVLTNRRTFVFSADVAFAATNDSRSSTLTS